MTIFRLFSSPMSDGKDQIKCIPADTVKQSISPGKRFAFLNIENDFELVIRCSQEIEHILLEQFSAKEGCSCLYEMISSAWGLTSDLRMELFVFAAIRNKVVHDRRYDLTAPRRQRFIVAFVRAIAEADRVLHHWQSLQTQRMDKIKSNKGRVESVLYHLDKKLKTWFGSTRTSMEVTSTQK